ncbi:MAG TPA: metallophosphoesterase family protein [Candidatus Didemnitutus sp.]|nr:metallophosphoesterase family protein [Candidatus Didemnitutus sp.]
MVEVVLSIAVIADTHDRVPFDLPRRLASADEIWHLGDVCAPSTLELFEVLGKPVHVVLGNNEDHMAWPLSLVLKREGLTFFLTHIPPSRAPSGMDVVLHGHTHVPRDETDERGVRWLNPGCITRPNRGAPASFAWLTLERGQPLGWKLVPL